MQSWWNFVAQRSSDSVSSSFMTLAGAEAVRLRTLESGEGSMLQCHIDGSFGVFDGRVDQRHRAVLGFDEHAELGAPEDYGLRAALDKVRDRSLELLPRSRQNDAFGKL